MRRWYTSRGPRALTPAYSAGLKRNGNVSLSSDHSTRMVIADVCRRPVVKEDTHAASSPHTRDGRTCRCVAEDTVNNRAKMSSATRRASSPQRGPRIRNFADPPFGIPRGVQETSGPPDAASRWHCYVGLIKRFGYRARSCLLPCNYA